MKIIFYFILFLSILSFSSTAQDSTVSKSELRIYLDCNANCDMRFIKTEINFVDFVPDRFLANIFIQINSQVTGSGGSIYYLNFIGQESFSELNDTLNFTLSSVATDDEQRNQLVKFLKFGITRYAVKTSLAQKLNLSVSESNGKMPLNATTNKKDPWNYWVFNIGTNGNFNKDDYSKSSRYSFRVGANRVTEKLKVSSGLNYSKDKREINLPGNNLIFHQSNYGGYFEIVKSVTDHWSYGGITNFNHSTYSNYDQQWKLNPAIEYSVFPYKDAVKKSITAFYQIGPSVNKYLDSSYYDKLAENIITHKLTINANLIQKWGNANASISYSSFLNSFQLLDKKIKGKDINNISLGGYVECRIVKGLSVYCHVNLNVTKGIYPNIRKADFGSDDILANVRQYPSSSNINSSVGISYRFGSIYNNVVNSRFNRENGGNMMMF